MMAVGAGLAVGLTEVGKWININIMVNCATGRAVIVTREVGTVAVDAFAGAVDGGTDTGSSAGVVTGLTASCHMDFSTSGERWNGGTVAAHAVGCDRCRCDVDCYRGGMTVNVAIEIVGMTLDTAATVSSIDSGVAMAVYP